MAEQACVTPTARGFRDGGRAGRGWSGGLRRHDDPFPGLVLEAVPRPIRWIGGGRIVRRQRTDNVSEASCRRSAGHGGEGNRPDGRTTVVFRDFSRVVGRRASDPRRGRAEAPGGHVAVASRECSGRCAEGHDAAHAPRRTGCPRSNARSTLQGARGDRLEPYRTIGGRAGPIACADTTTGREGLR